MKKSTYKSYKHDWKVSASFSYSIDPENDGGLITRPGSRQKFEVIGLIRNVAELEAYSQAHDIVKCYANVNDWILEKHKVRKH